MRRRATTGVDGTRVKALWVWFHIAGRRPRMKGYLKPALNRKERARFQV